MEETSCGGARVVAFSAMSIARVMGVCGRQSLPRILFDALSHFISWGRLGRVREESDRALGTSAIRGVEDRAKGHAHASNECGDAGGGSRRGLRNVAGSARRASVASGVVTVDGHRLTSHDWKTFTRTDAVAAFRLMIGSSGP